MRKSFMVSRYVHERNIENSEKKTQGERDTERERARFSFLAFVSVFNFSLG